MNRTQDPRPRECRLSETGLQRSFFKQLSVFGSFISKKCQLWKHLLYIRVIYTNSLETAAIVQLKNFKSIYCSNKMYRRQVQSNFPLQELLGISVKNKKREVRQSNEGGKSLEMKS